MIYIFKKLQQVKKIGSFSFPWVKLEKKFKKQYSLFFIFSPHVIYKQEVQVRENQHHTLHSQDDVQVPKYLRLYFDDIEPILNTIDKRN